MGKRFCVAAISVLALMAAALPAHAAFPGANGKIAFDANGDIFTMDPDGTSVTQLTTGSTGRGASFSNTGGQIAFFSSRDGGDEIYVMNADGSAQTRLTNSAAQDEDPA